MLDDRQGAKAIVLKFETLVPVIERLWLLNQCHRLWNEHETLYQPLRHNGVCTVRAARQFSWILEKI
jgi:hypothetical protein